MNWRETARTPRFFFLDARTLVPIFIFLMHMRLWTLAVAVISIALFTVLERLGYDLNVLFRVVRTRMIDKHRPINSANMWRRRCRM